MDRLLGAFLYIACDVVVAMLLSKIGGMGSRKAPSFRRTTLIGFLILPFPFLQFWVLTHEMLLAQLLIVAVLAAVSSYVAWLFQGSMGLLTIENQSKAAVLGMLRARENILSIALMTLIGSVLFLVGDFIVLKAYLGWHHQPTSYDWQQFVTTMAVMHFTVRGSLMLLGSVLAQTQLLSGFFDDDVRSSVTVSQIAGTIGAVYSVFIPLFSYDRGDLKSGFLQTFLVLLPVWELFAIYLAIYLLLWIALYLAGTVQHASQAEQFPKWRSKWLAVTRNILLIGDDLDRRADLLAQLRLLFKQLAQFKTSDSVSDYIAWRACPVIGEVMETLYASAAGADVIAEAAKIEELCKERDTSPLDGVFTEHRDVIATWDSRIDHVNELVEYARRTCTYLRGETTLTDFQTFIAFANDETQKHLAPKPEARRLPVRVVTLITSAGGVLAFAFKIYDDVWPHLRGVLWH